jgi:hypothetical protein
MTVMMVPGQAVWRSGERSNNFIGSRPDADEPNITSTATLKKF